MSFERYGHHLDSECPDRLMVCTCCMKLIPFRIFRSHLMDHMREIVQEIKTIRLRQEELTLQFKQIQELLAPSWNTNLLEDSP